MESLAQAQVGPYRLAVLLLFAGAICLEALISHRRQLGNYHWREVLANTSILAGMIGSKLLFAGYQLWVLQFFSEHALVAWGEGPWAYIAGFLLIDLLFYAYHYLSHRVKLLWAFHLVHHSSPWMNLTTAYRLNWLGGFVAPVFFFPALLLGLSPTFVAVSVLLNLLYQFFLHTELVGKLGWLELVFNTPSNHRVHHGSNPKYLDKNFGGVLIVWDRIFGTYQAEEERPTYGVTTGFEGHNPVWLVFHGFIDYFRQRLGSRG
jgi:sterol desaturase/sphingolipid hydroxylase (fatty acid hydroxylase superfamily)